MKCKRCGVRPEVQLRAHNAAFCRPCYVDWFRRQVERAVTGDRMFGREAHVLVAVSGGKDSLALWEVLATLGYRTTGFYLAQGIGGYSQRSREKVEAFAAQHGLTLRIADLDAEGLAVPDVAAATRRNACSACGTLKRHHFDAAARDAGCDVLATGHNLDDEAARLMGNVLRWSLDHLRRQRPVLEAGHPTLVRKVRPLYLLSEYETAVYAFMRGIDYVVEECPNAVGATQLVHKEALNRIEATSPGAKRAFVQEFLRTGQPALGAGTPAVDPPNACAVCGGPAWGERCARCRLVDEVARRRRPAVQPA